MEIVKIFCDCVVAAIFIAAAHELIATGIYIFRRINHDL